MVRRALLLSLCVLATATIASAAGWGSAAVPQDAPPPTPAAAAGAAAAVPTPAPEPETTAPPPPTPLIEDGRLERFGLTALLLFAVQWVVGRRRNAALAGGVAQALAPLLRRHFAHVGPGAPPARLGGEEEDSEEGGGAAPRPVMVREGADTFTIPASGRRSLGLTSLTIRTRPRHDALGLALALFDPATAADSLELVASLPAGLHSTVLVAGRPAPVRALGGHVADGGSRDVAELAGAVSTAKARCGGSGGAAWPVAVLAAADQAGVWHDLIAGGPLGALLAADPAAARALICVKVNTDGWGAPSSAGGGRGITASVALPPHAGADLGPVVRLVDALLSTADALAAYRPPPEAAAKAAKLRAEAGERAARREAAAVPAEDAAAGRRAARAAAEAEKLARMAPDAREKVLARKKRIEERRALAKRTKRL